MLRAHLKSRACSISLCYAKTSPSVVARLETRKKPQTFLDVATFSALEAERKPLQTRTEEMQAQRNALNKQIGPLKAKGESVDALMAEVNALKAEQEASAARLEQIQPELQALLLAVPNLPHASVPVGDDENGQRRSAPLEPARRRGRRARRWPSRPRTTWTSARRWAWTSRPASSSAGSRFTVMKGPIARLHRALAQFMLDMQTQQHGYTECYVPYIVNADTLRGTGQLPKFEGDLFAAKKGGQEGEAGARPRGAVPDPDQRSAADQLRARRDRWPSRSCRSS